MTTEYHKINSLQKRHTEGPNKGRFTGEWCDPVHEYLKDLNWYCREKVDGTNIRVHIESDPEQVAEHTDNPLKITMSGRTDNAQIPKPLLQRLYDIFGILPGVDGMVSPDQTFDNFRAVFEDKALANGITLYGEGFGAGIQKGGDYGPVDFILFDVKVGDFWLDEEGISDIAESLGIRRVPYYVDTLTNAIGYVSTHQFMSLLKEGEGEGLVCVPVVSLFNKWGERVIVKVKGVDFPR